MPRTSGKGFPDARLAAIGAPIDTAFVDNLKRWRRFIRFRSFFPRPSGPFSFSSRSKDSITATFASSYPSNDQALMMIQIFFFLALATSSGIFFSINFKSVALPAPQTPQTPMVRGLYSGFCAISAMISAYGS